MIMHACGLSHPGACKTYFRSLKDDNRRESRGVLNVHRKDLKVRKRIKQVNDCNVYNLTSQL